MALSVKLGSIHDRFWTSASRFRQAAGLDISGIYDIGNDWSEELWDAFLDCFSSRIRFMGLLMQKREAD